jgi:YscO-like protein
VAQKSDLPPYPLAEVLNIKKRRVEDAEKVVKEKQKALEVEREKLRQREAERQKVVDHHDAKLLQLRQEFDHGTTSDKITQMKDYLKTVKERVKAEDKKVKDQQQQVEVAEKNVELAKIQLKQREKEQDKIETHKAEWVKETLKEIDLLQSREEDELGSTMFLSKYTLKKAQK